MMKSIYIAAFVVGLVWASVAASAGSYQGGYAGYDWSDTYPPWAAEAFQPSR